MKSLSQSGSKIEMSRQSKIMHWILLFYLLLLDFGYIVFEIIGFFEDPNPKQSDYVILLLLVTYTVNIVFIIGEDRIMMRVNLFLGFILAISGVVWSLGLFILSIPMIITSFLYLVAYEIEFLERFRGGSVDTLPKYNSDQDVDQ